MLLEPHSFHVIQFAICLRKYFLATLTQSRSRLFSGRNPISTGLPPVFHIWTVTVSLIPTCLWESAAGCLILHPNF
jgi:hypothetical protein